jgi:hypothetical protein
LVCTTSNSTYSQGVIDLICLLDGRRRHLEYALHRQSSNNITRWAKWITIIIRRRLHRVIPLYTRHRAPPRLRHNRRRREPTHLEITRRWHVRRRSNLRNALLGISHFHVDYLQGELSIVNYTSTYNVGHVVGSVIIAIAATTIALTVFFKLREKWDDALWKRVGCAIILAAAVTGMHWTAATGTFYTLIPGQGPSPSRSWTVIVVAVIVSAVVSVFIIVTFILCFSDGIRMRSWTSGSKAEK